MSDVIKVTDANLEQEVLQSTLPVLIDFYADWCEPCKALAPIIDEVAAKFRGRLKVVKIDVDNNPAAAQAFRIQSMPTLMVLKDRQLLDRIVGLVDRKTLIDRLTPHLGAGGAVETWDLNRAKLAVESGLAVPVDIRSAVDFGRARLPHAVNVPPTEEGDRLAPLKDHPARRYLFYGRTEEGVSEIAEAAVQAGYTVAILGEGLIGWELAGSPVEKP